MSVGETMKYFSVPEAAAELRLSEQTVYGLCKRRMIRHERHGLGRGKILIPEDAIGEYRRRVTVEAEETSASPSKPASRGSFKHLRV
jgi:excisionase family DNA binding protein